MYYVDLQISSWFLVYMAVSCFVVAVSDAWFMTVLQEEMTNALATMRVDYDQAINIKGLGQSNNALLKKRQRQRGRAYEEDPVH